MIQRGNDSWSGASVTADPSTKIFLRYKWSPETCHVTNFVALPALLAVGDISLLCLLCCGVGSFRKMEVNYQHDKPFPFWDQ